MHELVDKNLEVIQSIRHLRHFKNYVAAGEECGRKNYNPVFHIAPLVPLIRFYLLIKSFQVLLASLR